MLNVYLFLISSLVSVHGYSRPLFSLRNFSIDEYEVVCIQNIYEGGPRDQKTKLKNTIKDKDISRRRPAAGPLRTGLWAAVASVAPDAMHKGDPYQAYLATAHQHLYGPKLDECRLLDGAEDELKAEETTVVTEGVRNKFTVKDIEKDPLAHYPCGQLNRAEVFHNKSAVHLPPKEFIHRGHACLEVTGDHMQTAINAFAILLEGKTTDVTALPSDYVLRSARAISMMKIAREKLAALWDVVKNKRKTAEVQHYELEMFRPLFKYVNAREMARLNLADDRILTYLGTHYELNRHQVGVIASRYIEQNKNWTQVQYLNKMNNLLCGVPMVFMRKVPAEVYLQLTYQIFYHIRACDPLQRRFYLSMMTRTEALGKSFSWSAQDVSRLGLLLAEVGGPNLANINPEAMVGITAQVMMEMRPENLMYFSEPQLRYLGLKPLNIMARKLKAYHDKVRYGGGGAGSLFPLVHIRLISLAILYNVLGLL